MSYLSRMLIPILVIGLVGVAEAKSKGKSDSGSSSSTSNELHGTVSSVSDGSLVLTSGGKKSTPLTITTDASTKVSIDGKSGKLADLQPGAYCTVTQHNGVAKTVKATSAADGKGKGASKKKT